MSSCGFLPICSYRQQSGRLPLFARALKPDIGEPYVFSFHQKAFVPGTHCPPGLSTRTNWLFGVKALGDSFSHNKLWLAGNAYFASGPKTVLAVRGTHCAAGGDVPYYDLCQFGAGADLHGYPAGRYRDRASWTVQAELRQHI